MPTYFWEVRRVHNDVMVGKWISFEEVKGPTEEDLKEYLVTCFDREPELCKPTFNPEIYEDYTKRWQYRRVGASEGQEL